MAFKLDRFGDLCEGHPENVRPWSKKLCPFSEDDRTCGICCALFERRGTTVYLHCVGVQYSLDYVEDGREAKPEVFVPGATPTVRFP